ncbi:hypothetical protein B0T21DRAFT_347276 [Apiosordaria backusii]|uniref:Uncharacterized protein n=1 Tax=Apiosordaria backusii TaxID=314023 RepID=A0AA40BME4_9PEZI|nr:hypothetical protein B0T21DRAFT_347276 [Apiosordaria backusii]
MRRTLGRASYHSSCVGPEFCHGSCSKQGSSFVTSWTVSDATAPPSRCKELFRSLVPDSSAATPGISFHGGLPGNPSCSGRASTLARGTRWTIIYDSGSQLDPAKEDAARELQPDPRRAILFAARRGLSVVAYGQRSQFRTPKFPALVHQSSVGGN